LELVIFIQHGGLRVNLLNSTDTLTSLQGTYFELSTYDINYCNKYKVMIGYNGKLIAWLSQI